jgi:DNA repair exonuclease SbcCD ATPase subunit
MAIARLRQLQIRNFRTFEHARLEELPQTGLVLVRGKNLDTGGHSGAGKSNLLLSLAYAFDYCPVPATLLQRDGTKDMQVRLVLQKGDVQAQVSRGNKTEFGIDDGNGVKIVKGGVGAVQKAIDEFVGLSPKLLQALTFRGQNERSLFLAATDQEKKEFLTLAIPELTKFEVVAEQAEEKAKSELENLERLRAALKVAVEMRDQAQQAVPAEPHVELADTAKAVQDAQALVRSIASDVEVARAAKDRAELTFKSVQAENEKTIARWRSSMLAALKEVELRTFVSDDSKLREQQELQRECNARLAELKNTDAARLATIQETILDINRRVERYESGAKREGAIRREILQLEQELADLLMNRCPQCKRPWESVDEAIHSFEEDIAHKKRELDAALADAQALAALRQLPQPTFEPDPMIAKLEGAARVIIQNVATEKQKLASAQKLFDSEKAGEVASLKAAFEASVNRLNDSDERNAAVAAYVAADAEFEKHAGRLKAAETSLRSAENELNALNQQLATARAVRTRQLQTLEELERRVAAEHQKVLEAGERYAKEADLALCVGNQGFLGSIFDEILAEISHETNSILAAIPNTAHIGIRYKSELSTKKGTKRTIVPVITDRGREVPLKGVISGGQFTGLELATDLSVGRVISRRTGVTPGWLIFDESFNGLGIVEKEGALEMLAKHAQDRLVLIVDHDNQFKEMFASTIDLEFSNGVTRIAR